VAGCWPLARPGVWGTSERKIYVRPCRATCRGVSPFCDIHLQQESTRPAWGLAAVVELRSCATVPQLLVWPGLHRFSVRLLPRPQNERDGDGNAVFSLEGRETDPALPAMPGDEGATDYPTMRADRRGSAAWVCLTTPPVCDPRLRRDPECCRDRRPTPAGLIRSVHDSQADRPRRLRLKQGTSSAPCGASRDGTRARRGTSLRTVRSFEETCGGRTGHETPHSAELQGM